MNCPYCGALLDDQATRCIECGKKLKKEKKESAFFSGFFSLILPLLGFILYFVYKNDHKRKAKVCLRNAFIGFAIYLILLVLFVLFWLFIIIGILTV